MNPKTTREHWIAGEQDLQLNVQEARIYHQAISALGNNKSLKLTLKDSDEMAEVEQFIARQEQNSIVTLSGHDRSLQWLPKYQNVFQISLKELASVEPSNHIPFIPETEVSTVLLAFSEHYVFWPLRNSSDNSLDV